VVSAENPDLVPPQIVLTHPFNRSQVRVDQIVYAVASDNDKVERVEFWLGRERLEVLYAYPYLITLKKDRFLNPRGSSLLIAVAYDRAGNSAKSWVRVSFSPLF
jgi:acetyltransferase-like isoleucine patch superfamily enzyme